MTAKLRRLTLQRFRSVRGATVEFDNPTFLVGQNGAGKSNIVDALSFLADAMALPLSAVMDKRGGVGALVHRSTGRGRVADMGLRVEVEGLLGAREAMYAFEVRATRDYGYEVRCEQCRCVAQDRTASWFHRTHDAFDSSIEAGPALALPLVAGDRRFAPLAQFLALAGPATACSPRTSALPDHAATDACLGCARTPQPTALPTLVRRSKRSLPCVQEYTLNSVVLTSRLKSQWCGGGESDHLGAPPRSAAQHVHSPAPNRSTLSTSMSQVRSVVPRVWSRAVRAFR